MGQDFQSKPNDELLRSSPPRQSYKELVAQGVMPTANGSQSQKSVD